MTTPRFSLQQILERQQAIGKDVGYALARTIRSCIQYNAAAELGATGAGNQCGREACMAAAVSLFSGTGTDGVPQGSGESVVEVLKTWLGRATGICCELHEWDVLVVRCGR